MVKFITEEQFLQLVNEMFMPQRAACYLMFYCGLRVSEIKTLRWVGDNLIEVTGKGSRVRQIVIPSATKRVVQASFRIQANPIRLHEAIKRQGRRIGLPWVHCHTLRHCLHPSTRIVTDKGIFTAEELFTKQTRDIWQSPPQRLAAINLRNYKSILTPLKAMSEHTSETITIKASGYKLTCSPAHRVFTLGDDGLEEIEAGKLQVGDYVAGVSRIEWAECTQIGEYRSRLIGYFLGDGNFITRGILLTEKNPQIAKFYFELLNKLYPHKVKIKGRGFIEPHLQKCKDKESYTIRFWSQATVNYLKGIGATGKSPERRVPSVFWQAGVNDIAQFLAGYYDAEGAGSTFNSASKELLSDVQMLLLRLGILSSLSKRERQVKLPQGNVIAHTMYQLYIHNANEFIFSIPTLKRIPWKTEMPTIPLQPLVEKLYQKYPRQKGKFTAKYQIPHLDRYRRLECTPAVAQRILKVAEALGENIKAWKALLNSPLVFHKVRDIIHGKEESVYDFTTVAGNLITNGLLSHNSYATNLLNSGFNLREIQELLGHASLTSTQIYTHISLDSVEDKYRKLGWLQGE